MTFCGLGRRRHDGGGVTVLLRGGLRLRQGGDGAQPLVQAGLLLQHPLDVWIGGCLLYLRGVYSVTKRVNNSDPELKHGCSVR